MDWNSIFTLTVEAMIGPEMVVYALAAIGVNIQFGYTGLLNFGQAGFLAVGAYGIAITVATYEKSFWLGVVIGLGGAVLLALLLGAPTLRLRADYLAIVTIAAAEVVRLTFRSTDLRRITGGSDGLQGFASQFYDLNPYSIGEYGIGPISFNERLMWVLTVGWILIGLTCAVVYFTMRSPWGRVLKAIREDEDAVRSLGKNVFSYKMQSLVFGGVVGALAGFMIALVNSSVTPDYYAPDVTFYAYTIVILGGAARVLGPVLGSAILWMILVFTGVFINEASRNHLIPSWLPIDAGDVGAIRLILVGLGLMLLVIFRPQGIFGDKREIALDVR
ncbi:MAG TPA: branched-chain amino acid ABC transporter permease [Actinomycetes bacterium]|nr:branched-chain amino acid ABC transporter permease [Actinomycetes bacterium]